MGKQRIMSGQIIAGACAGLAMGFADVGFRLAFSIGKLSGAAEVQRILQSTSYLR